MSHSFPTLRPSALLQRNTFKVSVRHSLQWMKQPLAAVVLFGRTGPLGADKAQRLRIVAITTDRSNAAIGTNGYDDPARRCTDPAKAALLMRDRKSTRLNSSH